MDAKIFSDSFFISTRWLIYSAGFAFFLIFLSCASERNSPLPEDGFLDISDIDFADYRNGYPLSGTWQFFPDVFLEPGTVVDPDQAVSLTVPGRWNEAMADRGTGIGTYRLHVKIPDGYDELGIQIGWIASAARIFINGQHVYGNGKDGGSVADTRQDYRPVKNSAMIPFLLADTDTDLEILFHVANFHDRDAGIMQDVYIAPVQQMIAARERTLFGEAFLVGSIFLIGLYHIGLFLNRYEDKSSVWFGLFCLIISLRVLFTGQYFIESLIELSYVWQVRFELLTFYLALPLFIAYLNATFPWKYASITTYTFFAAALVAVIGTVVLSMPGMTLFITPYIILVFLGLLYALFTWSTGIWKHELGARTSMFGGLFFGATVINDLLHAENIIATAWIAHYGLFVFIFSQSYILARVFAATYRNVISLADALKLTRDAYARFVPMNFLRQLGVTDITGIYLGQQVQKEMTIMFSDIRRFTSLSEKMSPRDNFNFLNSYLQRVTPIVQEHNGIIDNYIGDALMALYPESADDALQAAISMQREIREFNHERSRAGKEPIRVGMGLHHGPLMMGTIGSNDRMQGTVISDAVNLASRLENLTKYYDSYIIVSEAVVSQLNRPEDYAMRRINNVSVKGKESTVAVYEVYEGQPDYIVEFYRSTKDDFEAGIRLYRNRQYGEAVQAFKDVLAVNPADRVAQVYIEQIQEKLVQQ